MPEQMGGRVVDPTRRPSAPSLNIAYCLDFGFCFNYPKDYWFGYFDTLRKFDFNAVMLWVAGCLPVPGYEPTLAWRCDYVPEIVEYLHRLGFRVWLMTGVYGWLGMSPGLIRMHPEVETTWPDSLKRRYPMDSTRRGLCPTRGFDLCLDYVEKLYQACPDVEGLSLEVYCEKPHCQCADCVSAGLWKLELDFLDAIAKRIWKYNPGCEFIWPFGYERTHGAPPESRLYDEMLLRKDPRYSWWNVRMSNGYTDDSGRRHEWMDPACLARFGPNLLCLTDAPETFRIARQAGARGVVPVGPVTRYLFLPEYAPEHFGYFVDGPPADPPLYDHVLFQLWGLRRQTQFRNPDWTPGFFAQAVAEHFFSDAGPRAADYARYLLLLEDMILIRRVCMCRSAARIWGDIDGGDRARAVKLEPADVPDLRAIAAIPFDHPVLAGMRRCAGTLLKEGGIGVKDQS